MSSAKWLPFCLALYVSIAKLPVLPLGIINIFIEQMHHQVTAPEPASPPSGNVIAELHPPGFVSLLQPIW